MKLIQFVYNNTYPVYKRRHPDVYMNLNKKKILCDHVLFSQSIISCVFYEMPGLILPLQSFTFSFDTTA